MKHNFLAFCLVLALAGCALAQESAPSQAPAQAGAQSADSAGINATLKAYVEAYGRKSIDDLVAVWPDLPNEKKDYKKIKQHFADTGVSNEKVSLDSCDSKITGMDAVAKCDRSEEFVKTETDTTYGGDATMASPAQRPPPTNQQLKRPVKKTAPAWFKLHKNGDNWQIVSVSDKPI
jgi:hypothetical protein